MKNTLKLICFFQLLLISNTLSSQITNGSHKLSNIDIRNRNLKKYADSLINYKPGVKLPDFLFTDSFDYSANIPLRNIHSVESLRRFVLLEIKDVEVLERILLELSKSDKKNIKPNFKGVPYEKFSFYELIQIRIEELNNNEDK